jgi:hypothetical protein
LRASLQAAEGAINNMNCRFSLLACQRHHWLPLIYARHTARQNKEDIRRHSERRWRDDSSVAMSQAGVNDLIAVKYSHRCAASQSVAA